MISDHFETGAELASVERNGCFLAHDPVAFVPPRSIGIAHDLADAVVQQQRLYRAKKWKDQLETHSGNLTAMEAQRLAGLPRVEEEWLMRPFPPGVIHRVPDLRRRHFQRGPASGSKRPKPPSPAASSPFSCCRTPGCAVRLPPGYAHPW